MSDRNQSTKPLPTPTVEEVMVSTRLPSAHRQSAFGHALDGSQQLDILEEQIYANATAPARDQPMVPSGDKAIEK